MDLQSTDFEIMGVPTQFAQDLAALDAAWKNLQRQVHPDKFVGQGAAAQRVAMQWSVRVNEAYQRLKNPLQRASYLCSLQGVGIEAESNTAMPTDFLMQQMEWREALDDADGASQLQALADEVLQAQQAAYAELEQLLDVQNDYAAAAVGVRKLMFIQKFAQEIRQRQLG